MNFLAIDSTTTCLSVALRANNYWFEASVDAGFAQHERITDLIDFCFDKANISTGITKSDIDFVAYAKGPGSFTALRIGYSCTRGICTALNKPCIGIPSLDVYANGFEYFPGLVVPLIYSRKNRQYCALYKGGCRLSSWKELSCQEIVQECSGNTLVLFTGPDVAHIEAFLPPTGSEGRFFLDSTIQPAARSLAHLAEKMVISNSTTVPSIPIQSQDDDIIYLRNGLD